MNTKKFTPDEVKQAIIDAVGIKAEAARRLGCCRETVVNYCKEFPEVAAACEVSRERFIDIAENALLKKIQDGDTASIIFALKTLAKRRGFVERIEQTGADGKSLAAVLSLPAGMQFGTIEEVQKQVKELESDGE